MKARDGRGAVSLNALQYAIALAWIKQALPLAREVRWVADQGETPGWDIEVTDEPKSSTDMGLTVVYSAQQADG
jgi:hypothetical protein